MENLSQRIFRYFKNGALTIVPIIITIILAFYPLSKLSEWAGSFVDTLFRVFLTRAEAAKTENGLFIFLERYLPENKVWLLYRISRIPGINMVIIAFLICLFGMLASNTHVQGSFRLIERTIIKIPVINLLYSYVKESSAAFVGKFNKPVLIKINKEANVQKMGFITQKNVRNLRINEGRVAVYIPHCYAFSGELFFVKIENITPLHISATEAWKIILSGGIAELKP